MSASQFEKSLFKLLKDTARYNNNHPKNIYNIDDDCPIYVHTISDTEKKTDLPFKIYALCTREINLDDATWSWIGTQKHQILYNVNLKVASKGEKKVVIISDIKDSDSELATSALETSHDSIVKDKLKKLEGLKQSDENLLVFRYYEDKKVFRKKKAGKSLTEDLEQFYLLKKKRSKRNNISGRVYSMFVFCLPDQNLSKTHEKDVLLLFYPTETNVYNFNEALTSSSSYQLKKMGPLKAMMFTRDNNFVQYYNGPPTAPSKYKNLKEKSSPLNKFKEKCLQLQRKERGQNNDHNSVFVKMPNAFLGYLNGFEKFLEYENLIWPKWIILSTYESNTLTVETLREISKKQMPQEIKINPYVNYSLNSEHNFCFTGDSGFILPLDRIRLTEKPVYEIFGDLFTQLKKSDNPTREEIKAVTRRVQTYIDEMIENYSDCPPISIKKTVNCLLGRDIGNIVVQSLYSLLIIIGSFLRNKTLSSS